MATKNFRTKTSHTVTVGGIPLTVKLTDTERKRFAPTHEDLLKGPVYSGKRSNPDEVFDWALEILNRMPRIDANGGRAL